MDEAVRHSTPLRVILSNDPRAYREALFIALRRLRPKIDLLPVDPGLLVQEIDRHAPDLVILSTTDLITDDVPWSWILLYPDGARLAIIHTKARQQQRGSLGLDDLLRIIDESMECP